MRILIAEDDLISRKFLMKYLKPYGDCDTVVDGMEALEAFLMGWDDGEPYDLICLDIMMPRLDGLKVLKMIREIENDRGLDNSERARIIMTTILNDPANVAEAFQTGCEAYAAKPIDTRKLSDVMKKLGLIMAEEPGRMA